MSVVVGPRGGGESTVVCVMVGARNLQPVGVRVRQRVGCQVGRSPAGWSGTVTATVCSGTGAAGTTGNVQSGVLGNVRLGQVLPNNRQVSASNPVFVCWNCGVCKWELVQGP